MDPMDKNLPELIRENIARVIVGKDETVRLLLTCLFAGGHVLIDDVPGTGKTLMAKSLAVSSGMEFSRIQFTPDLLPSDITGLNYFDQGESAFIFRPGPVFTHVLLADEINRATPRTQSALLECMAEGQVTVDGVTRKLEDPFFVIATQNPVETLGTFPLPAAQMDRFLMRIHMGAMTLEEELAMISRFIEKEPLKTLSPVTSAADILSLRSAARQVFVHEDLRKYMARLVQATRRLSPGGAIISGASPRGTLALVRASQSFALLSGRDYVTPEDIRAVSVPVLAHRYLSENTGTEEERIQEVRTITETVEVPTEDWRRQP